jgi:SAM-dependent methyltransferase
VHTPTIMSAAAADNEPMNSSSQQHEEPETLHVHDLPQLYQKPLASELLATLDLLALTPTSFTTVTSASTSTKATSRVIEAGVPNYLTSIVSSSLAWIKDDALRERIWDNASVRLSERSGRSAMPAMTRSFQITDDLTVMLHEPSLTGDNLGLKTWASSLLLSKQLSSLRAYLPLGTGRVLELGAGTGLVGISAACLWGADVVLTDLPEIVPNLQRNLELNAEVVEHTGGSVEARALDWADQSDAPATNGEEFELIVAADPIYSSDHPMLLVDAIHRWLRPVQDARVVIELPLRGHYVHERANLRSLLGSIGLECLTEGREVGQDDWLDEEGNPAQVECEWSIWQPRSEDSEA